MHQCHNLNVFCYDHSQDGIGSTTKLSPYNGTCGGSEPRQSAVYAYKVVYMYNHDKFGAGVCIQCCLSSVYIYSTVKIYIQRAVI